MARNFNFSKGVLDYSINQARAAVGNLIDEQAKNSGKTSSKKKVIKKKIGQTSGNSKKMQSDEEKSRLVNKERENQFAKLEAKHKQEVRQETDDSARLREAFVLAEIIGQPRCKARRNRRARTDYGN